MSSTINISTTVLVPGVHSRSLACRHILATPHPLNHEAGIDQKLRIGTMYADGSLGISAHAEVSAPTQDLPFQLGNTTSSRAFSISIRLIIGSPMFGFTNVFLSVLFGNNLTAFGTPYLKTFNFKIFLTAHGQFNSHSSPVRDLILLN